MTSALNCAGELLGTVDHVVRPAVLVKGPPSWDYGAAGKPKGLRKTLETVADKITVANRYFVIETYLVAAFNLSIY